MNFTESFKFFKKKSPFPDLSDVVDPLKGQNQDALKTVNIQNPQANVIDFGLVPPVQWKIHELINHPGLLVIENPFTSPGQRYWITRCLRDFPKEPNRTNLHSQNVPDDSRKNFWEYFTSSADDEVRKKLKTSLRWSTLGYHHDWDKKVYTEEEKHPFPEDLLTLTKVMGQCLGFEHFCAQAAIVNFYPQGSTLSGHTDHSEIDLEAPLFSISFGQDAIFLIGGSTKDARATALRLHSGDVVLMTKESRLCYHAVPKILIGCQETWNVEPLAEASLALQIDKELWEKCKNESFWESFNGYLRDCRINLNIRQVLSGNKNIL